MMDIWETYTNTVNLMLEMQAIIVAFCSREMIVISDIRVTIVADVVLIATSSRLAEESWVSLKSKVISCLELSGIVLQSESNLSAQT